jgi:hypothetical protein
MKLIISLDILYGTLKAVSIHCKASRNEDNKIVKKKTSDLKSHTKIPVAQNCAAVAVMVQRLHVLV